METANHHPTNSKPCYENKAANLKKAKESNLKKNQNNKPKGWRLLFL